MTDFPSIATPTRQYFSQQPIKAQILTPFESGKAQSRARHTSTRWKFRIGWAALGQTDYATLTTFYDTYCGTSFNWTHPLTSTVYVVRFGNENGLPEAQQSGMINGEVAWSLSGILLEEV